MQVWPVLPVAVNLYIYIYIYIHVHMHVHPILLLVSSIYSQIIKFLIIIKLTLGS